MSWLKRIVPVAAAVAALGASACSESTAPGSVDATATATAVNGLNSSLSETAVLQSLAALGNVGKFASPIARAVLVTLPVRGRPWAAAAATRELMRGMAARAPGAVQLLFPIDVQGKTFQWDADSSKYRITDPTLAGAPSSGVRFILYQVDTATGNPSLPLTTTGYLDLTDASTTQANVLQVLLKVGSQTAASYAISEVPSTKTLSLSAAGYVTNVVSGGAQVNFTLQHVLSLSDSSLATNYQANSNGASVVLIDTVAGSGGTPSFALNWSVNRGGTIAIVGSGTDAAINVQFKINSTTVATASGPAANPSLSLASGQALTTADLLALVSIFQGFVEIEFNLSLLFTPGLLVFG